MNITQWRDEILTLSFLLLAMKGLNISPLPFVNQGGSAAAGGSAGYEVQRDRILDAIEAASGWAVPGGVAWISGDRHLSCVDVKNTPGDSWDVVNLTSAVWNKEAVAGSQDDATTVFMDTTNFSFGAISVFSDKLELSIRNSLDGKKMVSGFVYAGTNKWVSETLSVAI